MAIIKVCIPGAVETEYYDETDLTSHDIKYTFLEALLSEMTERGLCEAGKVSARMEKITLNGSHDGVSFELMLNEGLQEFIWQINVVATIDDALWKQMPAALRAALESTNAALVEEYGSVDDCQPLELSWNEERPAIDDDFCIAL